MKKILSFLTLLLLTLALQAQEQGVEDVVYLKDGNVFRGQMLEYKEGESIKLKSWNGLEFNFSMNDVRKVVQERIPVKGAPRVREYQFKETGIFNSTNFALLFGKDNWGQMINTPSIANVTGYQFNRYIGAGLGLGIDFYLPNEGEVVVPLFAQARGYFLKKLSTPLYKMDIGYGFGVKTENYTAVKGGLMFHPAIGYRFGAGPAANMTLDFGYKFQKASYTRDRWGGGESVRDINYNRYTLRIGVLF